MNKGPFWFYCLLFLVTTKGLVALPSNPEVISGHARLETEEKTKRITTSDKAILEFKNFNIKSKERVEFIQPSSSSTLLTRITGKESSKIYGELVANGRLFLVNPYGVYFGPESFVNVGSLVVSTLSIKNKDFLSENYSFVLDSEKKSSSIINEGTLKANAEGFIALLAPTIKNKGFIIAERNKIVLAAAEKITLDFSGDGLIRFVVDGDLEKALIENEGVIESAQGGISLSLRAAKKALESVVNTDGLESAVSLQEVNGEIRLLSSSELRALEVAIEAEGKIIASGEINAGGGPVHLLADEISLIGSHISTSSPSHGGEVLIGGDYQGRGDIKTAHLVHMDEKSTIYADALESGDGGKVILWSDDTTLFDGAIYARGGARSGNGGFVETSGALRFGSETGFVDTSAPHGHYGEWLLDPASITVATGGGGSLAQAANCGTNGNVTISPVTIASSASNVILCAQRNTTSTITVNNAINMTNAGVGITLTAGSTNTGTVTFNSGITTNGGAVAINGVVALGATTSLDTTGGGTTPAGANITFSNTINGAQNLTLNAGTAGTITASSAIGGTTRIGTLTITRAAGATFGAITAGAIAQTAGTGTVTFGALNTNTVSGINITGGAYTFNGTVTTSAAGPVVINNSGTVTIPSGSNFTPAGAFNQSGTGAVSLTGTVNTTNQNMTFNGPVTLGANLSLTSGGGAITFGSTINGAQTLSLTAGAGSISIGGNIGGTTPLTSFTIVSCNNLTTQGISAGFFNQSAGTGTTTINGAVALTNVSGFSFTGTNLTLNGNLTTAASGPTAIQVSGTFVQGSSSAISSDGAFTQSGTGTVQTAGSITTTQDNISFAGPVSLTSGTVSLSTGSTGIGNILFSSTVNGPGGLNLTAGTGNITFSGAAGTTTRIGAVTINSCTDLSNQGFTATSLNINSSGTATYNGDLNTSGASGVQLTGNVINRTGAIITTGGGSYTVTNSGLLTSVSSGTTSIEGSYTQNGSGNVSFSGSVITVSGAISFASPITLAGPLTLSTGTGGGNITLSNTVNGGQALTCTAGTGAISLAGAIGGSTRVTSLSINSAGNVTASGLTLGSLSQASGTGTTTFNGAINTNTSGGISLTGNAFTFNANATATTSGPITINNAGLFTLSSGIVLNAAGAFSQTGSATSSLAGQIVSGGTISFARGITLAGATVLNSSSANQDISLASTVDGGNNLTLNPGSGNITISGAIGGTTRIGNLIFTNGTDISTVSVSAATIAQSAGLGTTTFNGAINTNAVGGIQLVLNNFTRAGSIVTTNGGPLIVTNSGLLQDILGTTATLDGQYLQNGSGPVSFNGSMTTNNQPITVSSALTLTGNMVFNSGSGAGNISIGNTVNGAFDLTLAAGTGNITLSGAIGGVTPISALTFSSGTTISTGAIAASNITQTAGSGTTTFNSTLTTSGVNGISLTGTNFSLLGIVTTSANGPLTIAKTGTLNIGAALNVDGAFTQTGAGTVTLGANVTTNSQALSFAAPISLGANVALNSGTGTGNITLSSTVNGNQTLSLSAAGGNVTFGGTIGGSTPITSLTASGNNISIANIGGVSAGISGATSLTAANTLSFAGTTYNTNAISMTAPTINFSAGAPTTLTTSNDALTFSATAMNLSSGTDLTLNSSGGNITLAPLDAANGNLRTLIVNAGTGTIQTSTIGLNSANEFSSLSFTGGDIRIGGGIVSNSISFTPSGTIYVGGNITAITGSLSFPAAVVRDTVAGATLTVGTNISFSSTLDGDADNTRSLNLSAPSGNITFTGAIGATHPIDVLTISSAAITASGGFSQTGSGGVTLNNTITSAGGISFASAMVIPSGTATLTTAAANQPITCSSTINGPGSFTAAAGTSTVTLSGEIGGSTRVNAFTISSSQNAAIPAIYSSSININNTGGTLTVNGNTDTNGASGVTIVTQNFIRTAGAPTTAGGGAFTLTVPGTVTSTPTGPAIISGNYSLLGAGTFNFGGSIVSQTGNIIIETSLNLTGNVAFDSSGANGTLTFNRAINGNNTLTVNAGSGNIQFDQAIGNLTPISTFTITNAGDVTLQAVSASTIIQSAGSGTTTINGAVSTTLIGGISLTTSAVVRGSSITTINSGPLTISGAFTSTAAGDIDIRGAFTQSGGAVSIGGNIFTTADNISFGGAVTLASALNLDTVTGSAAISFGSTVGGAYDLTLNSRGGAVTFSGALGTSLAPIADLSIVQASSVTAANIFASSVTLSSATGTSSFSTLNTNGASGINLTGTTFSFNGPITTTTGGNFTLINSGTGTFTSSATGNIDGYFLQNGTGAVSFANSLTTAGTIQVAQGATLAGNTIFNSTGNDITFLSTINGANNLTLNASGAAIALAGPVGGSTRIGTLTISAADNVTTGAITASSIVQSAGGAISGTTLLGGTLNTNGAGGIDITSYDITLAGNVTTTGGGGLTLTNAGTLIYGPGLTSSLDGAFLQDGAGGVSFGGSITTTNDSITFTTPITLLGNMTLNTGSTGGNISVADTVDGNFDITLTAAAGDISFSGAIGGGTRVNNLRVVSGNDIDFAAVTANSIILDASSGTFSVNGDFNTNGSAGINLTGTNFFRNGDLISTNGGALTIYNAGSMTGTPGHTTSLDGGYFQTGPGPVNGGGTINTNNSPILFAGPLTLVGPTILNTGTGAGDITLSNTVNGNQNLTLSAGTGNISFGGIVGGSVPLNVITISSATDVSTTTAISCSSIAGSGIIGTTTFNDPITTSGALGIALSGFEFIFNDNVTTSAAGPVSITLTGTAPLTIASTSAFSLDGAFTQAGTGSVSIGGSITTTDDNIGFASVVNLTADTILSTGGSAGGNISFSGVVNGAHGLSLTAGTGNITFGSSLGNVTPLTEVSVVSGTNLTMTTATIAGPITSSVSGLTTLTGIISSTTVDGISLTSSTFNSSASLTTSNAGPIAIINSGTGTFSGAINSSGTFTQSGGGALALGNNITTNGALLITNGVTLSSPVIFTSGGNNITLSSTLDGGQNVTFIAGAGNISLGSIGSVTPLNNITITSAAGVSTADISAAALTQQAGTGLTHITGAISTSSVQGISLTGSAFTLDGTVTTSGGGTFLINHSGLFTLSNGATMSLDGIFSESGSGSVSLADDITTTNDTISFTNPVSLAGPVQIDSGAGVGDVTFASTINGAQTLTLVGGTGLIRFSGAVGGSTPLTSLSASAATIINNNSIQTTSTIGETGAIQLGGNMTTTNSSVTLTGNVTRTNSDNVTINTGVGAGNITITGTINGDITGRNLTLTAGTGSVDLQGTIGSVTPLQDLTISGDDISLANLGDATLGSTGTTQATATGDINFTGTSYNNGTHLYTAATNFNFQGGALTTITSDSSPITFVTGTIQLSPATSLTVLSNDGDVTLTNLLGTGLDLIVNAALGDIVTGDIGASGQNLNSITLTGASISTGSLFSDTAPVETITVPVTITTNVSTGGATLTYNAPVIVNSATVTFSTSDGGGNGANIVFNSTLNKDAGLGSCDITFITENNDITFNGTVGANSPFTSITIQESADVLFGNSVNAGSISQVNGTGTTTISGPMTLSAVGGLSLATANVTVNSPIVTSNNGPVSFDVSGALTVVGAISSDGAFSQTGLGTVSMGGSVLTSNDAINVAGATTLTSNLSLSSTGGNIGFASTINATTVGVENLTLAAGTGSVTLSGAVGGTTRLGRLTISSASDITTGAINATSILQSASTGTASYGALNTTTVNGINLTGSNITTTSSVTTTGVGPFVVTNSGNYISGGGYNIGGALTQNGSGSSSLQGSYAAGGNISFATPVSLSGATTMNTSAGSTNITFSSTIDGGNSLGLNLGSGGQLLFSGNVGGTTRLGAITITNASTVTAQNITAASISQVAGTTSTSIANLNTNAVGGISLTGPAISINGNVITTNSGPVTITNSGLFTYAGGSSTSISGAFHQAGLGTSLISGTLLTTNTAITFDTAVNLSGATSISSGAGAGTLTFTAAINGGFDLSLLAGSGNIVFGSALGSTTPLGNVTVQSVADITYPAFNSLSLTQVASSGTTIFSGSSITTGSGGISVSGNIITQNAQLESFNTGPISFAHTGTLTVGAAILSDGAFTETGSGGVSLSGSVTTTIDNISFANAITLTGASSLSSGGSGGGNILLSSTVNGNNNLTLTAGSGNITASGAIGGSTRIGALSIVSAGNVTTGAITAGSLSQLAGSGTTTFGGAINTNAVGGVSLIGSNFAINGAITTSTAGPLTLTHTGDFTFGSGLSHSISGGVTESGSGTVSLQGSIAAGSTMTFAGAITLGGSATLDSSLTNSNITISNTLDGPGSIAFDAGSGTLTLQEAVGGITAVNAFQITDAGTVSTRAITAGSISQLSGSVSSTFNGALVASDTGGISLIGTDLTFTGSLSSAGPVSLTNAGAMTLPIGQTITSTGAFTQSGGGSVLLGSSITTTNNDISFADVITLTTGISLSSGSGAGDITFGNTVDGAQSLTLNAGTGDITALGDIGGITRLGAVTFTEMHDLTSQFITCASIHQILGTGTTTVTGGYNTNTPTGMSFVGVNFTRTGSLVTTNGGSVTVTKSGTLTGNPINTTSIDGSYTVNGSGVINFAGTATVNTGRISFEVPVVLVGDGTLDSSNGVGGINIPTTIDGAHGLSLLAGNGNVAVTGAIGATTPLSSLTVSGSTVSVANIGGVSAGVSGSTSIAATGNINFNGTTYNGNTQTYNATGQLRMAAGAATTVTSSGDAIQFLNGIVVLVGSTNLSVNSSGGNITSTTIRSTASNLRTLSLNAGSGSIQVASIGSTGNGEFSSATLSGNNITLTGDLIANTISLSPTGSLSFGSNITSTNTALSFTSPVVLTGTGSVSSGSTGANISFSSTINATSAGSQGLTIAAGAGDITFGAAIGGTNRLNQLQISTAKDVSIGNLAANGFTQSAGTGTTTLSGTGAINTVSGFLFTGNNFNLSGSLTTASSGAVRVTNSGTFTLSGSLSSSGAFLQLGSGASALSGSISAGGGASFNGAVTLSGNPSINTSSNNQSVSFTSTLNGGGHLTITAGTGLVTLNADAGGTTRLGNTLVTSAGDITIQNLSASSLTATSTGTMRLVGELNTSGGSGINLTGVNFVRSGAIITSGGGSLTVNNSGSITGTSINTTSISGDYLLTGSGPVSFAGTVTADGDISVAGPISMASTGTFHAVSGDITLSNAVNGTQNLTLNAPLGNITISSPIGSTTPLNALTITNASNLTSDSIAATSISQLAGSGTSTFNGTLTTTGSGGISLIGTNFVTTSAWTAQGEGGISIQNSGTWTSSGGVTIFGNSGITQSGSGSCVLSGTLVTTNTDISLDGAITLSNDLSLDSGASTGNVILGSTVNGTHNITFLAGVGNVTVAGAIGNSTPVSSLTINTVNTASFGAVSGASVTQLQGSGTTTFTGAITTTGADGITLTGTNFALSQGANTVSAGSLTVNNSGTLTVSGNCSIAENFNQAGSGSNALSASISTGGFIFYDGALSLSGTSSLTTTSQPITLGSTVNGSGNLTLNAGSSTILIEEAVGGSTRLGNLTFSSASNITTGGLRAISITQSIGTGTTTIMGDLNTSGSDGITLTGTDFTISGNLITTNSGPCTISHTGTLTLTAGSSSLLSGAFTESGTGGSVLLSGTLHAENANVSFANPITLQAATTLNSNAGGNIVISDTIDGLVPLTLTAGTGDITILSDIGSITPLTSFSITTARNVTTQAISAGSIAQNAGTGTTTFGDSLTTTLPAGISLTGSAFTFSAPTIASNNGGVSITNSGTLTLPLAATFDLAGSFTQLGSGTTRIATTITCNSHDLSFAGPLILTGNTVLDAGLDAGNLTLSGAVNGNFDLTLHAGVGSVTLGASVGNTTPIGTLLFHDANNVDTKRITASSIQALGLTGTGTFDGILTTSGASGIDLTGASIVFENDVTTTGGGSLAVDTTVLLQMNGDVTLTGAFTKTNIGTTEAKGLIQTQGGNISFAGDLHLIDDLTFNSRGGDITFEANVDGVYALAIRAGAGNVTANTAISSEASLESLTIFTADTITLNGVGLGSTPLTGALSLTATNDINLGNIGYGAASQTYSSGGLIAFTGGTLTTLTTSGGSLRFTRGTIELEAGTDLEIITNGGTFSFVALESTLFENISIDTGSGLASLGSTLTPNTINTMTVDAGRILFRGALDIDTGSFIANGSIANNSSPVTISSDSNLFFNSVNSNVGSRSSPIRVQSGGEVTVGGDYIAVFTGSTIDNTILAYADNPPCIISFNGVDIKDCGLRPPTPPSGPISLVNIKGFATAGMNSSFFNLASDFYFKTYLLNDDYFSSHSKWAYYKVPKGVKKAASRRR